MIKMDKKKVPRFYLATLILAIASAIAVLLSSTIASAVMQTGDGGTSACTLVKKQAPDTTKQVCGDPICGWKTTCTACVPQDTTQSVLVSAGYWDTCSKETWVPGYNDCYTPSCYDVSSQSCSNNWQCDNDWPWDCWVSGQTCTTSTSTVCPSQDCEWVSGYYQTSTYSCWKDAVYDTKTVKNWVDKQEYKCDPNCKTETVPGDITYELKCPTGTTGSGGSGGDAPPPTNCYRDCVCSSQSPPDCCAGYTSAGDPECQPKICTADQKVSSSCSGCKTATVTMCNSYGTATSDLTSQLDLSCTNGCVIPTPTPPLPKICTPDKELSKSCTGCKLATVKTCNSLGTATYDSTVDDTSCSTTTACAKPIPVPSSCLLPMDQCNQKPKECSGNNVIQWSYDCPTGKCNAVSNPCGAGEQCLSGKCVKNDCTTKGCPSGYYCPASVYGEAA